MFGWEFPPYVTGGLGTACYGLTKELSKVTDRILFVIPRGGPGLVSSPFGEHQTSVLSTPPHRPRPGDMAPSRQPTNTTEQFFTEGPNPAESTQRGFALTSSQSAAKRSATKNTNTPGSSAQGFSTVVLGSILQPYMQAADYTQLLHAEQATHAHRGGTAYGTAKEVHPFGRRGSNTDNTGQEFGPHGLATFGNDLYGQNLFDEVMRYGQLASRFAHAEPFDVIHAHDWMTFPAGIAAKKATGRPLVVHVHALEFDRSGENIDQRVYDIEREGMHAADLVVAVSGRTRQTVIDRYKVEPSKVRVVHNGVLDLPSHVPVRMPPVFDEKVVVFLGRITMQKGPEYFIEAAWRVVRAFPAVRFVMAGVGDMLPRMILRTAQLRLNRHFHFTGFVSEEQRASLLARADLFVMTSVSEPFGLTPIEAAQHQVPLIIPHQSGVSEVLRHAIKVDFWDTDRIADAMIHVLSNTRLAEHMANETKADIHSATWGHAAQKLRELYQEVV